MKVFQYRFEIPQLFPNDVCSPVFLSEIWHYIPTWLSYSPVPGDGFVILHFCVQCIFALAGDIYHLQQVLEK